MGPALPAVRLLDYVFVDEAQDTDRTQRAMIRMLLRPGGRCVAVGDPAQAIYGFRGAGSDSMAVLAKECISRLGRELSGITQHRRPATRARVAAEAVAATRLPLTTSFRCAKRVVAAAQRFQPDIEAAEGAAEGRVLEGPEAPTERELASDAHEWRLDASDAILYPRKGPNAGLASSC